MSSVSVPSEPEKQRKTPTDAHNSRRRSSEQSAASVPASSMHADNFTIFEGTSEIQRLLIGRAVTGLDVR